jgi:hypothetical protein
MTTRTAQHSYLEVLDESIFWLVGGGILTVALFPISLPLILLTVAGVLPFLLVPAALTLVAAIVAAPVLLGRALWRWAARHPTLEGTSNRHGRHALHPN